MKSFLVLALIALTACNTDVLVELEATVKPLPVVKCLIASEKIRKDVVVIVNAVQKFVKDKNAFVLITTLLGVYPEVEAEVKRCLKAEGIILESIKDLPRALLKVWNSLPQSVRNKIIQGAKILGKKAARKACTTLLKKMKKGTEICGYI